MNKAQPKPRVIVYDTSKNRPQLEGYQCTYFNPSLFKGVDLRFDHFFSRNPTIIKRYSEQASHISNLAESERVEKAVKDVQEPTKATLPVDEDNSSEEPTEAQEEAVEQVDDIPDNYEDLPWGELRALALKHTEDKSVTKAKALEILAEAKGA